MKKVYHLFLLFALFAIEFPVLAQTDFRKGFIVTLKHDTIPGWVDYRGLQRNARICTFRKNENGDSQQYTPQELTSYQVLDGRGYESRVVKTDTISSERLFLEVLLKGRATLFYHRTPGQDHYLVEIGNEGVNELLTRKIMAERDGVKYGGTAKAYIGLLKYLLADCNRINPVIEVTDLEEKSLIHLLQQYNQCIDAGGELYKPRPPLITFQAGAKVGAISASASFPGGPDSPLENGYYNAPSSLTFGAFLNVLFPRISEKISFQTEVIYSKNQYDTYKEFTDPYRITRSHIRMNVSYLKVPLLLQYTYPKGKLRPFMQVGAYTAFVLQANSSRSNEVELIYNHAVDTDEQEVLAFKKNQIGVFFGLGTRYILSKKFFVFVEGRLERGNGLDYQPGVNTSRSKVNYPSLMIGLGF